MLSYSQFLTPASTVYSGFTFITYDALGYSIESLSGVKLAKLDPKNLNATVTSVATQYSAVTNLTLKIYPAISCQNCFVVIFGDGMENATCSKCVS